MVKQPFARIIFDVPAEADAFDGKGHQRSAKALSESISQLAEDRDGAIGLEGPWGSGKSTVIRLASRALNASRSNAKYHVFTFDLWTHHADDFKRAFLEEFITWLEGAGIFGATEAENERARVHNRTKSVDTTSRKTYSVLGAGLIILLPFLPLAYSWIGPTAFSDTLPKVLWGFTLPEVLLRFLFLAACIPILVLIASILVRWFLVPVFFGAVGPAWRSLRARRVAVEGPPESLWHGVKNRWRARPSLPELVSDVLSIFSRDTKKNTVVENIRDEDPTTVEFYSVFRDILARAQRGGKRTIVFVLDNIDRVPLSDIPETWSEIRAVFAASDARVRRPHSRVVAVVPYDRAYVTKAFSETGDETAREAVREEARFAQGDVFNKTFNRVLKVAPPLGSHWGAFLERTLREAFDDQLDSGAYKVFRLLQLYLQRNRVHATPRLIVGYVNEIGALWTQWGNEVPPESIALFVIFRSKIEDAPDALTRSDLVDERYLHIVDQPDWRRHLAALAFNVEPDRAEEILLGDRIADALVASTVDELKSLADLDGFPRVFQGHLTSRLESLAQEDAALLARAAVNVEAINLKGELSTLVWKEFARRLSSMASLAAVDVEAAAGLFRIVALQSKGNVESVAAILRDAIGQTQFDEDHFDSGFKWAGYLERVTAAVGEALGDAAAKKFWSTSQAPEKSMAAVGAACHIKGLEGFRFAQLGGWPQIADMHAALDELIPDQPKVFHEALGELAPLFERPHLVETLSKIAEALRTSVIEPGDARELIKAYALVDRQFPKSKSEASAVLQKLVADGTLLWYAHRASSSKDPENATGTALFLMIKRLGAEAAAPSPDPHPVLGALGPAVAWYQKLITSGDLPDETRAELIRELTGAELFPVWQKLAARDQTTGRLFVSVVGDVLDGGGVDRVDAAELVRDYDAVRAALGEERVEELLRQTSKLIDVEQMRAAVPDEAVASLPNQFVQDVITFSLGGSVRDIVDRLDAKLSGLTEEEWRQAFDERNDTFRLLVARQKANGLVLPPHTFVAALQGHIASAIAGTVSLAGSREEWSAVATAIPLKSRRTLGKAVLAEVAKIGFNVPPDQFIDRYYALAEMLPMDANASSAIDVVFRKLGPSQSELVRDYIRDKHSGFKKAFANVDKQMRESIADLVDGIEQANDADADWAAELRGLLDIPKRKATEPTSPEDAAAKSE